MAQALEFHRGQIEALMRAMSVAKIIREDKDPCMIEEGLYLGSLGAANNKDALKRLNLTHILTIARELNPPYPNEFVYKVLAVHDRVDANISHYFEECFDFIEEAKGQGGGVLVHCFAGKSRSATIVIAYLMKKHGMSHSEAFQLVKSRRPVVSPNAGFMTQLENYDKTLKVEPAPSLCPASLNAALTILKISLHKQVATKQSKRRRSTASLEHFAHEAPVDICNPPFFPLQVLTCCSLSANNNNNNHIPSVISQVRSGEGKVYATLPIPLWGRELFPIDPWQVK